MNLSRQVGNVIPYSADWLAWQLADSAFPTGGFAHSAGLEAALQQGGVSDLSQLEAFLHAQLSQFGRASLPFMTAAHRAPDQLADVDRFCDRFTTNHVANRASRLQGQALLASAERIFGARAVPARSTSDLESVRPPGATEGRRDAWPTLEYAHLAPVFGALARALDFNQELASRLFCFTHLRGLISAAVRLGIVGPLQAQALQHQMAPHAEAVLVRCQHLSLDDLAQTAPLLDLWQANHDRLYSRLFQS